MTTSVNIFSIPLPRLAEEEAKKIVSIPLPRLPTEDKLIWHHEKSGEFSVKIVYHDSVAFRDSHKPGPSSSTNNKLWHEIWRTPILNRTRNFMWRVAKNILPTRGNLIRKGMSI